MAPLRVPRFRALWAAATVSNVGSFLQQVAASWLMLQLTGSATWVGLMVASTTLPLLVVALPAGALADVIDRRRVLLVAQGVMATAALAMAALAFTGLTTPGLLLGLGLLLGTGLAFNLPAWQALVPELVPRSLVPEAVALNSASFNVARAVGPALGGLLVATAGPGWAFAINAVSYVAVAAVLASPRDGGRRRDPEASLGAAIALGLRYTRFTPTLRRLLALAASFAVTTAVLQAMLPNLSEEVLGGDAVTYGLLLGAMGAGALVGALTRRRVGDRLGRRMVPTAITAIGVAGIGVGLSRAVPLTAACMAVAGVMWVWTLVTLNSTVQLSSPAWVRGRVMSLYTLSFVGFLPLGSILGGVLGDAIGVPGAIVALSSAAVVLGLATTRLPLPALGEVATPEPTSDWRPGPHPVAVEGGPVMVLITWVIDEDDLAAFLDAMAALRVVRLRTGAYSWRLYRSVEDAHRMTEVFMIHSWTQHLRQHERIDRAAAAAMARARAFDRAGGPVTRHLAAVDVVHPAERPDWDRLLAVHEEMHRTDGSTPLDAGDRLPR